MAQFRNNTFIFFLATLIFFVGAGITIVDFCCSGCISDFFSSGTKKADFETLINHSRISTHSCCGIHGHEETDTEYSGMQHEHDGNCCHVERLQIDLDHLTYKPTVAVSWIMAPEWNPVLSQLSNSVIADSRIFIYQDDIPISSPRDYLSWIRILII